MSLRVRILLFLAVAFIAGITTPNGALAFTEAAIAYVVFVMPYFWREEAARVKVKRITVGDPHGHLARELGVPRVPGATLRVDAKGTPSEIRAFRRRLEHIARHGCG